MKKHLIATGGTAMVLLVVSLITLSLVSTDALAQPCVHCSDVGCDGGTVLCAQFECKGTVVQCFRSGGGGGGTPLPPIV